MLFIFKNIIETYTLVSNCKDTKIRKQHSNYTYCGVVYLYIASVS